MRILMFIKSPIYLSECIDEKKLEMCIWEAGRGKKSVETLQHIRFPGLDRATPEEKSSNKYTKLQ